MYDIDILQFQEYIVGKIWIVNLVCVFVACEYISDVNDG